jgi:hypothetical protein
LLSDSFSNPLTRHRRRRPTVLLEYFDPFSDDLAQLGVHFGFIVAVTARTDNAPALADEAPIFVGPFHGFYVSSAVVHDEALSGILLGNQLPNRRQNCFRNRDNDLALLFANGYFVLSYLFFFGHRFVMRNQLLYALFIPAVWKL